MQEGRWTIQRPTHDRNTQRSTKTWTSASGQRVKLRKLKSYKPATLWTHWRNTHTLLFTLKTNAKPLLLFWLHSFRCSHAHPQATPSSNSTKKKTKNKKKIWLRSRWRAVLELQKSFIPFLPVTPAEVWTADKQRAGSNSVEHSCHAVGSTIMVWTGSIPHTQSSLSSACTTQLPEIHQRNK